LISTASFSQFSSGQKMIGGSLGVNASHTNNQVYPPVYGNGNRSVSLGLGFSYEKFKSPNVFAGGGISYSYQDNRYSTGTPAETGNTTNGISLYVDKTRLETLARKFYLTFTGSAGVNLQFTKATDAATPVNQTKSQSYGADIAGSLGLLYQLNQRFLLNCTLNNLVAVNYQYSVGKTYAGNTYTGKTNSSVFSLSTGLNGFNLYGISFGFRYLLRH
jgi:hypothetical protein